jgi:hypothetical protein
MFNPVFGADDAAPPNGGELLLPIGNKRIATDTKLILF